MYTSSRRMVVVLINAIALWSLEAHAFPIPIQDGNPPANTQNGQSGPGLQARQQQQQQRMGAFAQYLQLSDDQKRQFMQIQRETGQSVRAARHDDTLSEELMQQKIKQIHAQQRERLLALLTPEQQALLKKWNEEQKQKQSQTSSPSQGNAAKAGKPGDSAGADDDFFAGMVQDPNPPTAPQQPQAH